MQTNLPYTKAVVKRKTRLFVPRLPFLVASHQFFFLHHFLVKCQYFNYGCKSNWNKFLCQSQFKIRFSGLGPIWGIFVALRLCIVYPIAPYDLTYGRLFFYFWSPPCSAWAWVSHVDITLPRPGCVFFGRPSMGGLVVLEFKQISSCLILGMWIPCLIMPRPVFLMQSLFLANAWAWVTFYCLRILRPRFASPFFEQKTNLQ